MEPFVMSIYWPIKMTILTTLSKNRNFRALVCMFRCTFATGMHSICHNTCWEGTKRARHVGYCEKLIPYHWLQKQHLKGNFQHALRPVTGHRQWLGGSIQAFLASPSTHSTILKSLARSMKFMLPAISQHSSLDPTHRPQVGYVSPVNFVRGVIDGGNRRGIPFQTYCGGLP